MCSLQYFIVLQMGRRTGRHASWRWKPTSSHRLAWIALNPSIIMEPFAKVNNIWDCFEFRFRFSNIFVFPQRWSEDYRANRGDSHRRIRPHSMGRCYCAVLQSMGENSYARAISAEIPTAAPVILSSRWHRITLAHQPSGFILTHVDGSFAANSAQPLRINGRRWI